MAVHYVVTNHTYILDQFCRLPGHKAMVTNTATMKYL